MFAPHRRAEPGDNPASATDTQTDSPSDPEPWRLQPSAAAPPDPTPELLASEVRRIYEETGQPVPLTAADVRRQLGVGKDKANRLKQGLVKSGEFITERIGQVWHLRPAPRQLSFAQAITAETGKSTGNSPRKSPRKSTGNSPRNREVDRELTQELNREVDRELTQEVAPVCTAHQVKMLVSKKKPGSLYCPVRDGDGFCRFVLPMLNSPAGVNLTAVRNDLNGDPENEDAGAGGGLEFLDAYRRRNGGRLPPYWEAGPDVDPDTGGASATS